MEIYLIRHTSVDVPKGTCYGHTDVSTRASFPQEAAAVKASLGSIVFDKAYTSPLSRAAKLAAFCGYPDATMDDRLKEMYMGSWEMMKYDEIKDDNLELWYKNYVSVPTTGGESFLDLYARVSSFLDDLRKQTYRRVVVFAHGGVLICARAYAGQVSIEEGFGALTDFGGIERIEI